MNVTSREEAMVALKKGLLVPSKSIRNYGWKSHLEVCKWLGLPKP